MEINPLVSKNLTEEQLRNYVILRDSELGKDYTDRVHGLKNQTGVGYKIAGYNNLRLFFDGDHWSYFKEDGTPTRVFNYCRKAIENYTCFMANEPPEDDVPPRDTLDEIEIARAEQVEKVLGDIKADNQFPILFADASQNQSLLGDCFIFGPYVEWMKVGKEELPRIRFSNIKKVENVRILWSDENYDNYEGFIFHYRISVKQAERIYEKQIKERGISLYAVEPTKHAKETGYPMTEIVIYWDDTYMLAMLDQKVIDFAVHNWGFVPGVYVKNETHPTRPWGVSDIEDMLDSQVEYNEVVTETRGKVKQTAIPHVFYSGEGEPAEYTAGQAQMIKLGPNDRVWGDPMASSTAPFESYIGGRKQDIHQLSMISEIFYGGPMVTKATGRALSVLMQGVNNKVKLKQQFWTVALQKLNANILRLIELYVPKGKDLIQGYYKTDIFFPAILIRNVTEEINKFNMKLQSMYTTMKNLGVPSPKEEQKLMKREWSDMELAIEISRNPQARMQMQQMLAQTIARLQGLQQQPMLKEGGAGRGVKAEEEMPMSTPRTPVEAPTSSEGAIELQEARGR